MDTSVLGEWATLYLETKINFFFTDRFPQSATTLLIEIIYSWWSLPVRTAQSQHPYEANDNNLSAHSLEGKSMLFVTNYMTLSLRPSKFFLASLIFKAVKLFHEEICERTENKASTAGFAPHNGGQFWNFEFTSLNN